MSATDELRALLDERGVEWRTCFVDDAVHTMWDDAACWFTEFKDGTTVWGKVMEGSPAQAVEATLGPEMCKIVSTTTDGLVSEHPKKWVQLSCGHWCGLPGFDKPNYCPVCGAKVVNE